MFDSELFREIEINCVYIQPTDVLSYVNLIHSKEINKFYLPEKVSRDVQLLSVDDNNFVSMQNSFGHKSG
jgi:hypothetical protein